MSAERFARLKEVVQGALRLPVAERSAYVDEQLAADTSLRAEARQLVADDRTATAILETGGAAELVRQGLLADLASAEVPLGDLVGPYRLVAELGQGGMGAVYLADQEEPIRRRVALKLIKIGMDTREVIARFDAERQALAMMDHPHIAKVHDAGATEQGRPYFVMEYVDGIPITDFCDHDELSIRARLDLFLQVARAIHHAHQKGIIHRDIKPSNVLVSVQDGTPSAKVIDFGIAKATDQRHTELTRLTAVGMAIGTPEYMSPEQAAAGDAGIDTTTDVYSLGVLLYQLLTGSLPFEVRSMQDASWATISRTIREVVPPKPSTRVSTSASAAQAAARRQTNTMGLRRQLRGDLDWIVMKAMEKDRTRRYLSASEFAADIERHLQGQPVSAGPPSSAYRLRKFVSRYRTGLVVTAVIFLTVVVAAVVATRQRAEAVQARGDAEAATTFLTDMMGSVSPESKGRQVTMLEVLESSEGKIEQFADRPLIEARIEAALGKAYFGLGYWDKAQSLQDSALAIRERELHGDHLDLAQSLNDVANLARSQGDLVRARTLYERALAMRERLLGPTHPDVARSLSNLGSVLQQIGEYPEAQALFERALAIQEKSLGPEHPDVGRSLNNLATVLKDQGEYARALQCIDRSIEIKEKTLGPLHPSVANSLISKAAVLNLMNDTQATIPLLERALAIHEQREGSDHPEYARALSNLGSAKLTLGDFAGARVDVVRSIAIFERNFGPDNSELLMPLSNLGLLQIKTGELTSARATLDRALKIAQKDPESEALAGLHSHLAMLAERTGDSAGAAREEQLALAIRQRVGTPLPHTGR